MRHPKKEHHSIITQFKMADDGMLLNFEVPSETFTAPKPTFRGGSWKDRLTARKSAEYGRNKAAERANGNAPEREQNQEARPTKRAKTGDNAPAKANPGDFVSSLFTFNPTSTVTKETEVVNDEDETSVEASNAPLNDELAKFTSLGLSSALVAHLLKKLEIKAPTAIQRKAVKQLCENDTDAFIQAQTGSGKTLAYLLPIVERIMSISKEMKASGENFTRNSGLFALVLAPTRELSKQISDVLETVLACCHWIVSGTVIGGEQKQREKARLRKGVNILVATPGRLTDHLNNTEVLDVSNVRWLVLDEGDRLMELGFEQDIQKIISVLNLRSRKSQMKPVPGLPERRTTVLCSATIKSTVEQLRSISLKDPVSIAVDAADSDEQAGAGDENNFSAPAQLKQSYAVVPAKQRLVTLVALLKQTFKRKGSVMKCIVFISCADSVDFHFELLTRRQKKQPETEGEDEDADIDKVPKVGKVNKTNHIHQGNTIAETRTQGVAASISGKDNEVNVFRLHGSMQQATRTSTLKAFSTTTEPAVLVCTDVAARGLDLPNVDLVVEYDPPFSKDDHLHRIGRTARAGRDGRAMIFLQPGCEERYVDILKESKPRNLTRHDADELLKKGFAASSGVVNSRDWEVRATDYQLDIERWALDHPKHLEQGRRAYQSHIRAYATHVSAEREIFNMKELQLGHLAKAFALRDRPSTMGVPGLRPGAKAAGKNKAARKEHAAKNSGSKGEKRSRDDGDHDEVDAAEAKRKMFAKVKMMSGGASEFNLG
jgi:ATP-dependent RNA helicase DDX31/DBP7